jgi:hypothetical protein
MSHLEFWVVVSSVADAERFEQKELSYSFIFFIVV